MKRFAWSAAFSAALIMAGAGAATAADLPIVSKGPVYTPPASVACAGAYDFFFTACPLSWYGITVYGTIDVGGTYQTHGTPFDPNHPVGASYLLGNSSTNAVGRNAGFGLGPNAHEPVEYRRQWVEPVGGGWSFIGQSGTGL